MENVMTGTIAVSYGNSSCTAIDAYVIIHVVTTSTSHLLLTLEEKEILRSDQLNCHIVAVIESLVHRHILFLGIVTSKSSQISTKRPPACGYEEYQSAACLNHYIQYVFDLRKLI